MANGTHERYTDTGTDPGSDARRDGSGSTAVVYAKGMEHLVHVVQELSLARSLEAITAIVRRAARELTGADGATFVLREGDLCYYADEDAIAPLWKGRRFPIEACISGWAMLHRRHVAIEDIYADERIPHDAYRPTFVKSLIMVPIRTIDPIGAIGTYWATTHRAGEEEVGLLCALADTVAVAMENVRIYAELEDRVRQRTAQLEAANEELEAFNYAVSHDLRAPLRAIRAYAEALAEQCGNPADETGVHYLDRMREAAARMQHLIDDLLTLSRTARAPVAPETVDLTQMAGDIVAQLRHTTPERRVDVVVEPGLTATGDPNLLRIAFENLVSNAWKFSGKRADARIEIGSATEPDGRRAFFVRDNGVGFDGALAEKLFQPFQRLHPNSEFPGTGVGLATVQRIVQRHGGRIRAEGAPGEGATFVISLPDGEAA